MLHRSRTVRSLAILIAIIVAPIARVVPAHAEANPCHEHGASAAAADGVGVEVRVRAVAASFDNSHGVGHYQGLALGASWTRGMWFVAAELPAYQLALDGADDETGLGDAVVAVGVTPLALGGGVRAGVGLVAGLPSGDADAGLGMGHVMLMPGVVLSRAAGRWDLSLRAGWGGAVGDDGGGVHGHDHGGSGGGPGPIVSPMNRSEVWGALRAGVVPGAGSRWSFAAEVGGAAPVGVDDGEARVIAGAGAKVQIGPVRVGLDAAVPLVGHPFDVRGAASVGIAF